MILEGLRTRAKTPEKRAEREAELNGPPLPAELAYLWKIFSRLSNRRPSGFSGSPIPWSDIDAFCRLSHTKLFPWEIEIIEDLDRLFLTDPKKLAEG